MPLTAAILASYSLPQGLPPGPLAHAAAEIAQAAGQATSRSAGRVTIEHAGLTTDGFTVRVAPGAVHILGGSPRGALNAAYWLLEHLGFAWIAPGPQGTVFAPGRSLGEGEYRQQPSFSRRTLILGQDALHDDWRDWLEWASRNRLNDLFFHDTPPSRLDRAGAKRPAAAESIAADGGGWMFERWDQDGALIRAAAEQRGMTVQFGGHHLPALIPRDLFAAHPEWFPVRKGQRDQRYNLCVSNPEAMAHLRRSAAAFFERFRGASVYHLWADDIVGGGWCSCGHCDADSPSDQALIATNALAEVLAESQPGARIAHLAYHDTLQPPAVVWPRENVNLLWAPRERCYAHPIDDTTCQRNRDEYWKPFLGLLPLFENDPSRVDAFEYYSDAVLFKWLAPPLLSVLPQDAKVYRAAGVGNLQNLMVSPRPSIGAPWHAWWMAKCAWDADVSPEAALTQFCEAAYPTNASAMSSYYQRQDGAYAKLLDLHDLQPMRHHDVLDFSDTPRETMRRKAAELRDAAAILAEPLPAATATPWLEAEQRQAELTSHVARHLAARVTGWQRNLDGEAASENLASALAHLEWLENWETAENTPAYANLSRRMLMGMRFHTRSAASSDTKAP